MKAKHLSFLNLPLALLTLLLPLVFLSASPVHATVLTGRELLLEAKTAKMSGDDSKMIRLARKLTRSKATDAQASGYLLYFEVYLYQNNPAKALRSLKKSQKYAKKALAKHPLLWFEVTQTLIDYHWSRKEAAASLPYALELHFAARKHYGFADLGTLSSGLKLASIYESLGKLPSATLFLDWVALQRSAHPENQELQSIYPELLGLQAAVALQQHDSAKSIAKAIALYQKLESLHRNKGDLNAALVALDHLAGAEAKAGKLAEATEHYRQLFIERRGFLDATLSLGPQKIDLVEQEALLAQAQLEQDHFLSLLARLQTADAAKLALAVSLQQKGYLVKMAFLKKQQGSPSSEKQKVRIAKGKGKAKGMGMAEVEEILQNLPKGQALVDFQEYQVEEMEEGALVVKQEMLAVVAYWGKKKCYMLLKCANLQVALLPLGPADVIGEAVTYFRMAIQEEEADEGDLVYTGEEVYRHLWQPIEELLQDSKKVVKEVYLIPDGSLHLLPFDVVPTAEQVPLGTSFQLKLLGNVGDIRTTGASTYERSMLILAGPDYDVQGKGEGATLAEEPNAEVSAAERIEAGGIPAQARLTQEQITKRYADLRELSFDPIYGAKTEGLNLQKLASTQQWKCEIYHSSLAEEQRLREWKTAPQILHIATYSFALTDVNGGWLPPSGLVLAGFNSNAPFFGEIPPENDGMLSAMEVLDLSLTQTRLVVLSATETAVGEAYTGKGLSQLRSAFQLNGVENVISTLWPVNDVATQIFMGQFYQHLWQGQSPREALRAAQRAMQKTEDWGHPYYWATFVIVGKK